MTVCPGKTQISLGTKWLCAQGRLRSAWADAQADLNLHWANRSFCWFCHEVAHLLPTDYNLWSYVKCPDLWIHLLIIVAYSVLKCRKFKSLTSSSCLFFSDSLYLTVSLDLISSATGNTCFTFWKGGLAHAVTSWGNPSSGIWDQIYSNRPAQLQRLVCLEKFGFNTTRYYTI